MTAVIIIFIIHWYGSLFFQTFFHHRYASHAMFTMSRTWEKIFHILSWIFQGSSYLSPYTYGVMHRHHHAYADTENDPHSPQFDSNFFTMMWRTRNVYNDIDHDQVDVLAKLGYNILISNFSEYYRMVDYFSTFTNQHIGVAMGVNNLLDVFDEEYYKNLPGGILEAFGKFFKKDMRVYLYPYKDMKTGELLTSENLKVHDNLKELYKYFKLNKRIVDIENFNPKFLEIYSREILKKILTQELGWEEELPIGVSEMIKDRQMFGYKELTFDGLN